MTFDAVDEARLAKGRQKDSTFPRQLPATRKDKCFICGSKYDVLDGICGVCEKEFPTKHERGKERLGVK
jgi:hypothetical protein